MKLCSSVLLAATALASACSAEFTISSSPAAAPAKTLGDNEPFAKTWTVSGAAPLATLQLQTLGRVFVDYDASIATAGGSTVAQVILSGNNTDLLDAFEVINADNKDDAIEVHMKNDKFEGQGYLLTRVVVATKQALRDLSVAWSSDTVVGNDVLVAANESAALAVSLAGSADVYVGSADATWSLHSFSASVAGSGSIQVVAKSVQADDVVLSIAGSGDVAVVADEATIKGTLASAIAGSGDVTVQSDKLEVFNLTSAIGGSGDITYSRKGSCQEQSIAIAGSGDVSSASIVCVNTDVNLVGSGDVLVQTTGNLHVSSLFGSDVSYYGATPSNITVSGLFNFRGSHKNTRKVVKEAKRNVYDEYDVVEAPARAPVYVLVKTSASMFSDEPKIRYDLELDTYDAETVAEFLSRQDSTYQVLAMNHVQNMAVAYGPHASGIALFAVVGAALVAVGVAAVKHQRRRERQQYAPLV